MADKKQLFDDFMDRELDTLELMLVSSAERSAITINEYVQTRLTQGASSAAIRTDLLNDLKTGGRIFGEFRNSVRSTVNGSINRVRDDTLYTDEGIATNYRWVAILVNTCPDCMGRHGVDKAWEQWEADGLPRTGQTVCKQFCTCILIPSDVTDLDKVEPIMRAKK